MNTIQKLKEYVYKYAKEYGYEVPDAILAQAITESGINGSGLSNTYHNWWGMKAGSDWKGKTVTFKTKEEYVQGVLTPIYAKFRVYENDEQGTIGYFEFLKYKRYKDVKNAKSVEDFAEKIRSTGWATSYTYRQSIIKNYKKYVKNYEEKPIKDKEPVKEAVKILQQRLNDYGNYHLVVDGIIGPKTTEAYNSYRRG